MKGLWKCGKSNAGSAHSVGGQRIGQFGTCWGTVWNLWGYACGKCPCGGVMWETFRTFHTHVENLV